MRKMLQSGSVQAGIDEVKFASGPQMREDVSDDQWERGEVANCCGHDDDIEGEVLEDI
jgi:hypothetical protein